MRTPPLPTLIYGYRGELKEGNQGGGGLGLQARQSGQVLHCAKSSKNLSPADFHPNHPRIWKGHLEKFNIPQSFPKIPKNNTPLIF